MNDSPTGAPPGPEFLAGGGETGALIAGHGWSATPLGPIAAWPQSLKTATAILLRSPVPMVMLWGDAGVMLYNDAYSVFAGGRHPALLGSNVREGWPEVADFNDHVMRVGLAGGTLAYKDQELTLFRHGRPEQVWMNLDYSPVLDEAGRPAGVLAIVIETTERVAAERRAGAERERQRRMLQQMPGFAGVLTGPEHRYEYVNDAYVAISGDREFVGRTVREVFPEVAGQGYFELLDRVYATGVPFAARAMPIRLDREDGERAIDLLFEPVRGDDGAVAGIFVGGYDVTDRVRAEQRRDALLRLDERLRDVSDVADLSYAAAELLGAALGVARVGYGVFDAAAGTIAVERDWVAPGVGSVAGVHHFRDYGSYIDDLRRGEAVVIANAASDPRTAHRIATFRSIGCSAFLDVPVVEHGRTVAQVFVHSAVPRAWQEAEVAFVRDFAERTHAAISRRLVEQELRASEARLRAVNADLERQVIERTQARGRSWAVSPDLMGALNAEGYFETSNPAWHAVLGWSEEEVRRTPIWDLVHPDDVESTRADVAKTLTGRPALGIPNRYRGKDGAYRWISWVAVVEDGLIYCTGRDISGEKQREAELAARQAELETAQEALRQAQKMEAVGQLTGGIAHDFNNLLTGVIGSLDMMQRRIAKGEMDRIERHATTAMTAANRAAALTHRLLAFSRRQPLDPKPVNANRLVSGMEELLRRTIGESISLEIVTAGGLWQTRCDPHQLESAILNLAINARDAMPDGGKLTIETCNAHLDSAYAAKQRDVIPGQYICICVTDTGTGMSKETMERAFEPFFTTKPIGQGTGLGLSMIYGFTRQSDGYARIYSELGKGSTIKLYLPRYYGEAESVDAEHGELTDAHRAEAGEVVLVVEDEAAVRSIVVDVLEELGYRAVQAADGPSGLKLLQSPMRIDLLVTDIGLPGLNGRQVADAARLQRPALKVLFMTGYAENATIANGFLEPGMQMITKPFAIEALATRIRDMIESG